MVFDPQFVLEKLNSLGVSYTASGKNYLMECPICHEGHSSGKRKRCYFLNGKCFHCHNCQQSYSVYDFLKSITGQTFYDLKKEQDEWHGGDSSLLSSNYISLDFLEETPKKSLFSLPEGCVNLCDAPQKIFYSHTRPLEAALKYCNDRLLFSAVNRVDLYYCHSDYVHKGRLVIPFYNDNREIVYYQSRFLPGCDIDAKYLSKSAKKTILFNQHKIEADIPYLFVFEGPIDAMFVRNGVAIAGLAPTQEQMQIIDQYRLTKDIVWVLDNEPDKKEVRQKYQELSDAGEKAFLWREIDYKDINDLCVKLQWSEFPWEDLMDGSGDPILFLT